MDNRVLELALEIIRKSSRELPADRALHETLSGARGLRPEQRRRVSELVFGYYRWFGWLSKGSPFVEQIGQASALAARFAKAPKSFSQQELIDRSLPAWVNTEMQVTAAWAAALQSEPKLWLRARPGQGREIAGRLGDSSLFGEGLLSDILQYRGNKDLFRTAEFHAGQFELQDISSQAVGFLCDPKPDETWWDACAGEGGKTLHLSSLMGNKGLIWATDRAEWRLQKLRRRAARAKVFNYRTALWDGGPTLPTRTRFDGVLVDAPCSGLGTWHRNPHARWTTTLSDVRELGELQFRLLSHAATAVKPGGKLFYAVCTMTRTETVAVTKRFGAGFKDFKSLLLKNPLAPGQGDVRELWLWPQHWGSNGMFVAAWIKPPGAA